MAALPLETFLQRTASQGHRQHPGKYWFGLALARRIDWLDHA